MTETAYDALLTHSPYMDATIASVTQAGTTANVGETDIAHGVYQISRSDFRRKNGIWVLTHTISFDGTDDRTVHHVDDERCERDETFVMELNRRLSLTDPRLWRTFEQSQYTFTLTEDDFLQSLAVTGLSLVPAFDPLVPAFDKTRTSYAVTAPMGTASVTIAAAAFPGGTVRISPADADMGADGHQVAVVSGSETPVAIKVTAQDGETSRTYTLSVFGTSGPPVRARNSSVDAREDVTYTFRERDFNFLGTGATDTLASVKVVTPPSAGTLALDGTAVTPDQVVPAADIRDLTFTPVANANGDGYARFTFKVSNATDESASAYTMTVDVTPVNDRPTIVDALVGRSILAGTPFEYVVPATAFSDVDGDTLSYAALKADGRALPGWLTFTAATRTFSGTPGTGDTGTVAIGVTASDDSGGASLPNRFDIEVRSANNAPTAANATVTTTEDTAYAFAADDFNFSDPDTGNTLASVRVVTLPAAGTLALDGADVNADDVVAATDIGDLTFTPAENANGSAYASFTFKVSDGLAESADAYTMTIDVTAVNDAPVAESTISTQAATINTQFRYEMPADTFSDADGETLGYSAASTHRDGLPDWLSFDRATRVFSGTPTARNLGETTVTVTAADPAGETATVNFDLLITAIPNSQPTVTASAGDEAITIAWSLPALPPGVSLGHYEYRWAKHRVDRRYAAFRLTDDNRIIELVIQDRWENFRWIGGQPVNGWVNAGTATSREFTGLCNGQEHTFEVRAITTVGPTPSGRYFETPAAATMPTIRVEAVTTGPVEHRGLDDTDVNGLPEYRIERTTGDRTKRLCGVRLIFKERDAGTGSYGMIGFDENEPARVIKHFTYERDAQGEPYCSITTQLLDTDHYRVHPTDGEATVAVRGPGNICEQMMARQHGQQPGSTPVKMADANLRDAVDKALGRGTGSASRSAAARSSAAGGARAARAVRDETPGTVTRDEMATIEMLDLSDRTVKDLTGLEFATAGPDVYLGSNRIQVVPLLAAGTRLRSGSPPPPPVAPEPFTAAFGSQAPEHDGGPFYLQIQFSEPLATMRKQLKAALVAEGGTVTDVAKTSYPEKRKDQWRITVQPDSYHDVVVTLPAGTSCEGEDAVCTATGEMLSEPLTTRMPGPAPIGVGDARAGEGAALSFEVSLADRMVEWIYADWSTRDGTATAGEDYVARSGSFAFKPGQTSKTVEIAALTDSVEEGEETFEVVLSNVRGTWVASERGEGTIENTAATAPVLLTASFENVPGEHDGRGAFTFETQFSEELPMSYVTMRDSVFSVLGGTVTRARRLAPPGNRRWEIRVEPSGNDAVSVAIAGNRDCTETGAVCTGDGRKLSNSPSATVAGPPSFSVNDVTVRMGVSTRPRCWR